MEEKKETQYRISGKMVALWTVVSGLADALTLIPLVGDFVGPVYWFIFSVYLWRTKHGLVNWKTAIPEAISVIAEIIPVVQGLPTIITATGIILAMSRIQDKTGIPFNLPKKAAVTPPRKQLTPLNKDGVRLPIKTRVKKELPKPQGNKLKKDDTMEMIRRREEISIQIAQHRQEELGLRKKGEYVNNDKGGVDYVYGDLKKYGE